MRVCSAPPGVPWCHGAAALQRSCLHGSGQPALREPPQQPLAQELGQGQRKKEMGGGRSKRKSMIFAFLQAEVSRRLQFPVKRFSC